MLQFNAISMVCFRWYTMDINSEFEKRPVDLVKAITTLIFHCLKHWSLNNSVLNLLRALTMH